MKTINVVLAVMFFILVMASQPGWAGELQKVRIFEDGDRGKFVYPFASYPQNFAVMNPIDPARPDFSGEAGTVCGTITPATVVLVVNRNISRENLDLLNGHQVVVYGKFKDIGEGEGLKRFCLSLTIFVIPTRR